MFQRPQILSGAQGLPRLSLGLSHSSCSQCVLKPLQGSHRGISYYPGSLWALNYFSSAHWFHKAFNTMSEGLPYALTVAKTFYRFLLGSKLFLMFSLHSNAFLKVPLKVKALQTLSHSPKTCYWFSLSLSLPDCQWDRSPFSCSQWDLELCLTSCWGLR